MVFLHRARTRVTFPSVNQFGDSLDVNLRAYGICHQSEVHSVERPALEQRLLGLFEEGWPQ